MMGQAAMGTMTWQLTQNGSNVTGSMSFSGMPNMMRGTFSGTMTAEEMTFTMHLPVGSMMSGTCSVEARRHGAHEPGHDDDDRELQRHELVCRRFQRANHDDSAIAAFAVEGTESR